jgi:putative ABC transport system permease protein
MEPVVLISEQLWRARYNQTPDAVGRTVRINGRPHTIIGILPDALSFPPFAEVWLPMAPENDGAGRADRSTAVIARLAEGVTLAQSQLP